MSNFGKIKNIWNLDVVSREEMKTTLQEWDNTLSTFQTELNEVKRLTTFKIYSLNRLYGNSSPSVLLGTYGDSADETKPFFIEFRKSINSTETIYNFVAFFSSNEDIIFLTENLKIKIQLGSNNNLNGISIIFIINGLNSNEKIGKFKVRYTPKTLTSIINETQEEGETWETSK